MSEYGKKIRFDINMIVKITPEDMGLKARCRNERRADKIKYDVP
jgi:hypothetical protein